jgi:hypothetical protein
MIEAVAKRAGAAFSEKFEMPSDVSQYERDLRIAQLSPSLRIWAVVYTDNAGS